MRQDLYAPAFIEQRRMDGLMVVDSREVFYDGVDSEGQFKRRPKSPHLTIYKFRLSMLMSIGNRAAGVASAAGLGYVAWWLNRLSVGKATQPQNRDFVTRLIGRSMAGGWCAAAIYHVVAGLRHLVWDDARRLEKSQINADGPPTLLGAGALICAVFACALMKSRRNGDSV